mmetsp:Transcript_18851/g.48995  ORF Transcript_18851/g.48995 Transcript_18851/m.48995 type:complete len:200 (-) Transcript_18851:210-809(-)
MLLSWRPGGGSAWRLRWPTAMAARGRSPAACRPRGLREPLRAVQRCLRRRARADGLEHEGQSHHQRARQRRRGRRAEELAQSLPTWLGADARDRRAEARATRRPQLALHQRGGQDLGGDPAPPELGGAGAPEPEAGPLAGRRRGRQKAPALRQTAAHAADTHLAAAGADRRQRWRRWQRWRHRRPADASRGGRGLAHPA